MFCFAAAHFRSSIAVTAVLAAGLASFPALCQNAAPAVPPSAPELRVFDPSLIDKTVDPCDNFYHYSCNGWFKRNPLPADSLSRLKTAYLGNGGQRSNEAYGWVRAGD